MCEIKELRFFVANSLFPHYIGFLAKWNSNYIQSLWQCFAVFTGFWWVALVTMTTVGYGAQTPQAARGVLGWLNMCHVRGIGDSFHR